MAMNTITFELKLTRQHTAQYLESSFIGFRPATIFGFGLVHNGDPFRPIARTDPFKLGPHLGPAGEGRSQIDLI